MSRFTARRNAIAEWLLEFSVLWAVFPLLDQILRSKIDKRIVVGAVVVSMLSFGAGLLLIKGGDE